MTADPDLSPEAVERAAAPSTVYRATQWSGSTLTEVVTIFFQPLGAEDERCLSWEDTKITISCNDLRVFHPNRYPPSRGKLQRRPTPLTETPNDR